MGQIVLPIRYSQFDSRWAGVILGNNTDAQFNIYNYGCLDSDLASILQYYGVITNPLLLNKQLKENGGFETNDGSYVWGSITRLFSNISENRTTTPDLLTDAQIGEIKNAIDAGFPVVIQIDYNPKTVALDSHFVIVVGYNPNDENDFTIVDPLGGTQHSLKDYLGFFFPNARKDIQQYIIYKGPVPISGSDDTMVIQKAIFPPLVHGSTQWDATVTKYLPGQDAKTTDFPALQSVVAGIQSNATAANNQVDQLKKDVATANQNVTNAQEKLNVEQKNHEVDIQTLQAKISALTPNSDQYKKLTDQYDNQIADLKKQNQQLLQDKHDLAVELVKARVGVPPTFFETLVRWLSNK